MRQAGRDKCSLECIMFPTYSSVFPDLRDGGCDLTTESGQHQFVARRVWMFVANSFLPPFITGDHYACGPDAI